MKFHCPHFRTGFALTIFIAITAFLLARFPGLGHLGVLPLALLFGIAMRALLHISKDQHPGIHFSAKHFLRVGVILLGVRLNFQLIAQAGFSIFLIVLSVVSAGLLAIPCLGRCLGLQGKVPLLIAIDTSICGASAVGVTASVIDAEDEEVAIVVPICSLMGTLGVFGLNAMHHILHFSGTTFGVLVGATLHEVAQVMAAASMVPASLDSATMTKMMRVALLGPVVFILRIIMMKKHHLKKPNEEHHWRKILGSVWFVFGFLIVGAINTCFLRALPHQLNLICKIDEQILAVATFLMAMAMAGLGLQVNFEQLRAQGMRTVAVVAISWFLIVMLVACELYIMSL